MKYAVIRLNGKQYKVSEGEELVVDKLSEKKPEAEVLLFVDGEKREIGKPVLTKRSVLVKVLGDEKGKKLMVMKYKAKSRYRKKMGFRSQLTRLQVEKIS